MAPHPDFSYSKPSVTKKNGNTFWVSFWGLRYSIPITRLQETLHKLWQIVAEESVCWEHVGKCSKKCQSIYGDQHVPIFSQHIPNMFPCPNIFMALNILLTRSQRFPNISPFHGASFAPGLRQWGAQRLWPRSASARLAPGLERWGLFATDLRNPRRLYPWLVVG